MNHHTVGDHASAGSPFPAQEGEDTHWVRTSVLREHCNPFAGCWRDLTSPLTLDDVAAVLAAGEEALHVPVPWPGVALDACGDPVGDAEARLIHAQKVAWFVRHGFQHPISFDVGVPSLGCRVDWMVEDGNHRLASGVFRLDAFGEDECLPIEVSGSLEYAQDLGLAGDARGVSIHSCKSRS